MVVLPYKSYYILMLFHDHGIIIANIDCYLFKLNHLMYFWLKIHFSELNFILWQYHDNVMVDINIEF